MAHTPGPWKVTQHQHCLAVPTPHWDVWSADTANSVFCMVMIYDDPNEEANARLIAAAPELLKACEAALKVTHDPRVVEQLGAAIAKAKGTPQ